MRRKPRQPLRQGLWCAAALLECEADVTHSAVIEGGNRRFLPRGYLKDGRSDHDPLAAVDGYGYKYDPEWGSF